MLENYFKSKLENLMFSKNYFVLATVGNNRIQLGNKGKWELGKRIMIVGRIIIFLGKNGKVGIREEINTVGVNSI